MPQTPTDEEEKVRALVSSSFESALDDYKGSCYILGAKAGGRHGIDCSGFVYVAMRDAFQSLKDRGYASSSIDPQAFNTSSEYQFEAVNKQTSARFEGRGTDFLPGGRDEGALKAGMIIARSSGRNLGWNAHRALKIDHIACIYKDSSSGELMVAESSGRFSRETGSNGVQRTRLTEWLERNKNHHLFAADPVKMVLGEGLPSKPTAGASRVITQDPESSPFSATAGSAFNENAVWPDMLQVLAAFIAVAYAASSQGSTVGVQPRSHML